MKFNVLTYLICASIISACGKYKHEPSNPTSCELCAHAITLEGTYRGQVYINELFPSNEITDSATITVSQLFLNNNTYDDSTTMYFLTAFARDSLPNTIIYDTVNIHDTNGIIEYNEREKHWIRNDSIYH
ncbi:MAG: hypothetical protein P8P74_09830 [Crocinitomicaceae bacterium]|nr:hypothetical protein [Crocinitomicaceae bacterium]